MPAKKKIGSVHTAKNGAKYKITAKGARFISGPTKGPGSKKKGGSAQVGGSILKRAKTVMRIMK